MAVAEASFNISIDSMSAGLMSFMFASVSAKPSTTYNGSVPALMDAEPRIRIVGASPGWLFVNTATPLDLPCSASIGLEAMTDVMASLRRDVVEPVKSLFFIVPYPTTTTSAKVWVSSFITISNCTLLPTLMVCSV